MSFPLVRKYLHSIIFTKKIYKKQKSAFSSGKKKLALYTSCTERLLFTPAEERLFYSASRTFVSLLPASSFVLIAPPPRFPPCLLPYTHFHSFIFSSSSSASSCSTFFILSVAKFSFPVSLFSVNVFFCKRDPEGAFWQRGTSIGNHFCSLWWRLLWESEGWCFLFPIATSIFLFISSPKSDVRPGDSAHFRLPFRAATCDGEPWMCV